MSIKVLIADDESAILEIMGEAKKDGSRENPPPAGVNYVSFVAVGVRKG